MGYTFREYTEERLAAQGETRPIKDQLCTAALGLAGEAGEFVEIIKKHLYHDKPLDKERAEKELGDVLWYLNFAANAIGSSLEQVAITNNIKLRERYPNGFSLQTASNLPLREEDHPAVRAFNQNFWEPTSTRCAC